MSLVSKSFIHCMRLYRKLSLVLLSISSLIGLVRGYRMTNYPEGNSILLPYSDEIIKETVFSNYATFGWIFFTLIGVFGIIAMIAVLSKFRYFAYLIIIESIFLSFFTLLNILFNGLGPIHLFTIPYCVTVLVLGVLQTPKEF